MVKYTAFQLGELERGLTAGNGGGGDNEKERLSCHVHGAFGFWLLPFGFCLLSIRHFGLAQIGA